MDVAKGGTAVVECEVANRAGRVQWTKDGLTLGKEERRNLADLWGPIQ